MASAENQVLCEKGGVFIHTQVTSADDDALVEGKVFLIEKPDGVYIEWRPVEDVAARCTVDPKAGDEWAVIDTVGYKPDKKNRENESVELKPVKKHKHIVNFDIKDLKSFKRSKPSLGWSYLIFILKDGTTYPALHFHKGGSKDFLRAMEVYLSIKKSPNTSGLFLVYEHDPGALSRSFDELHLFGETSADLVSKFVKDPYTTTMTGFSKVTKFLGEILMTSDNMVPSEETVSSIINEELPELPGVEVNTQEEPGYELVTRTNLPPRHDDIIRGDPLNYEQWQSFLDESGKVKDVDNLKAVIFRGGIEASIRKEVWKFLLGYYPWDSTTKSRDQERKKRVDDYFRMKLQWKSVTPEQEKRFTIMKDRKSLIDKDVTRTDRTHSFFQGEGNKNLENLNDILMTYCMYNFDLGYVQGMSDLLAPILVIMENEVDAFWCLAGYMEFMESNFEMDQKGMKTQLEQLNTLLNFIDPQLYNYLESHESGNLYFCFRWLLIHFKREFTFPDVMRLWEVLWTGLPCKNFHLLLCLAILDAEKNTLMDNNFGFTEILKHINDISFTIDLGTTLKTAEAMYFQLVEYKKVPSAVRDILGLQKPGSDGDSKASTPESYSTPATTPNHELSLGLTEKEGVTTSNASSAAGTTVTSTPDDSSIEILPEIGNQFIN